MKEARREAIASSLTISAALAVCGVSFLLDVRLSIDPVVAKALGAALVAMGMGMVVWSALHLKGSFFGAVQPLGELVRSGPYRVVRHPVYLGFTVAMAGIPVATRSFMGLLVSAVFFLPAMVYRARLEDAALAKRFGSEWFGYAARTGFLLPRWPWRR